MQHTVRDCLSQTEGHIIKTTSLNVINNYLDKAYYTYGTHTHPHTHLDGWF